MNRKSIVRERGKPHPRSLRAPLGAVALIAGLWLAPATAALATAQNEQPSSFVQGARDTGRAVGLTFREIGQGAKNIGLEVGRGARDVGVEIGHGAANAGREIGQAAREGGRSFGRAIRGE